MKNREVVDLAIEAAESAFDAFSGNDDGFYPPCTIHLQGLTIKIIQDEDAESPRDWSNVGTMVCWHRDLGDEQRRDNPSDWFNSLAEDFRPGFADYWDNDMFRRIIKANYDEPGYKQQRELWDERREKALRRILYQHYIMLPLGLFDHSGISMYVGSQAHFCDPGGWDSGQVGWIYCTKAKAIEEWGGKAKRLSKKALELAVKYLTQEVETYDQYLTGDVWGYVIEDEEGNDVDSCWGFFGSDYCKSEALGAAKAHLAHEAANVPAGDIPLIGGCHA